MIVGVQRASAACQLCGSSGSFTGTLETVNTVSEPPGTYKLLLKWAAVFEPTEANAEDRSAWHLTELSGALSNTQEGRPCSVQLTLAPNGQEVFQSLLAPYVLQSVGAGGELTGWNLAFNVPLELGIYQSSDPTAQFCNGDFTGGSFAAWGPSDKRWSQLLHGVGGARS